MSGFRWSRWSTRSDLWRVSLESLKLESLKVREPGVTEARSPEARTRRSRRSCRTANLRRSRPSSELPVEPGNKSYQRVVRGVGFERNGAETASPGTFSCDPRQRQRQFDDVPRTAASSAAQMPSKRLLRIRIVRSGSELSGFPAFQLSSFPAFGLSSFPAYSVFTVSCESASAAFNVCHARLAHFTRMGNSRTPANAASLPSPVSSTG